MNSFKMIINYWLKSKRNFFLGIIFQLIAMALSSLIPALTGKMIASLKGGDPAMFWELIGRYIIIISSIAFLSFLFSRGGRVRNAEVASRALYELRNDINGAIYKQSFSYFDKVETGQLVARATSDVEQTQAIFGFGLNVGIQSLIQMSLVFIIISIMSVKLAIIFYIIIPTALAIIMVLIKKLQPIYFETREAFGELTSTLRENIVGAEVVRIFSKQDKELKKFVKSNKRFYDAGVHSVKLNSIINPINLISLGMILSLILYIGGGMVLNNEMDFSTLIAFLGYVGMVMFPLSVFSQILLYYIQADAALRRISEVLESTPDIVESPDAIEMGDIKGHIEFENVSFGYTSDHLILKGLNFEVKPGEHLAIIGTTGSGKSTIISLLPRFYDVREGSIKIDGVDIRKYKLKDLRKNIGIVSQETYLFNRSIKDNIAFGKEDASMEEIKEAARVARLDDFIESLPDKYETIIGERGTRLSGGQKQRLSIARAVLIKPKILILDDSTSSVDVETEYEIQQTLEVVMKDRTSIIITQRISSIRNADKIMVLDQGRIVGLGTHEELINDNPLYRQIYETLYYKQKKMAALPNKTNINENLNGGS
ncbi:MAG: ABC transporter ATP-binding protein [Promethearchaeota archaeon]